MSSCVSGLRASTSLASSVSCSSAPHSPRCVNQCLPRADFAAQRSPWRMPVHCWSLQGLYIQMVGRGLRCAPGKEECLVIDQAGCTLVHGPIAGPHGFVLLSIPVHAHANTPPPLISPSLTRLAHWSSACLMCMHPIALLPVARYEPEEWGVAELEGTAMTESKRASRRPEVSYGISSCCPSTLGSQGVWLRSSPVFFFSALLWRLALCRAVKLG